MSTRLITLLIPALLLTAACGGGSDDDDDSGVVPPDTVSFTGNVRGDLVADTTASIPGVTVCALGSCDETNNDGEFGFTVPTTSYSGGSVLFDLNGSTIDATTQVDGLNPSARAVDIEFLVEDGNTVNVSSVSQDTGPVPTPQPTPTPDPGPLSNDPQQRACQILERSNITITDFVSPIVHEPTEACPEQIDTIIAVGNNRPIAYEYEVLVDVPDLVISPASAQASQGDLTRHTGNYLCTQTATFVANVTARVVRYFPSEGEVVTREEAISRCGSNAAVGNTDDTKQITVEVR